MCRARCITHQGRVISATGVHNHPPHMKGVHPNSEFLAQSGNGASGSNHSVTMRLPSVIPSSQAQTIQTSISQSSPAATSTTTSHMMTTQHAIAQQSASSTPHTPEASHHSTQMHLNSPSAAMQQQQQQHGDHHSATPSPAAGNHQNNGSNIQNIMQNVLSPNNLMHLSAMTPILNPIHNQQQTITGAHSSSALQITPVLSNDNGNVQNMHSPISPRSNVHHLSMQSHQTHGMPQHGHQQDSINMHQHHHHHSHHQHSHLAQQTLVVSSADNNSAPSMSIVVTSTSVNTSEPSISSSPSIQQTHNVSPNGAHPTSITSESNIMTIPMNSQSSFKLEQM